VGFGDLNSLRKKWNCEFNAFFNNTANYLSLMETSFQDLLLYIKRLPKVLFIKSIIYFDEILYNESFYFIIFIFDLKFELSMFILEQFYNYLKKYMFPVLTKVRFNIALYLLCLNFI